MYARTNSLGRVGDDFEKRGKLRESGKFIVWSVTWDDVRESEDDVNYPLSIFNYQQVHLLKQALQQIHNPISHLVAGQNTVRQLYAYLSTPSLSSWEIYSALMVLAFMSPQRPPISNDFDETMREAMLNDPTPPRLEFSNDNQSGDCLYGAMHNFGSPLYLLTTVPSDARSPDQLVSAAKVTLRLHDPQEQRTLEIFKNGWRQSLQLSNLFQFLPGFNSVTSEQILEFPTEVVLYSLNSKTIPMANSPWEEVLEYAAPECINFLQDCQIRNLAIPIVGYELLGAGGQIVAEAELAWQDIQIAYLLSEQEQDANAFVEQGWQVFYSWPGG